MPKGELVEITAAVRREFLRLIYRTAAAATENSRKTYIDGLATVALACVNTGKTLSGASGGGFNSNYSVFAGWDPGLVLFLCDWARSLVAEADVDDSIAEVNPRVASVRCNFTSLFIE